MINRRHILNSAAASAALAALPLAATAQAKKDSVVLAMALEPPGLDPTAGAASAIAEIVQYNLFETLKDEIEEGRELFKTRVSVEIFKGTNFFDRAIVDVVVKPKGYVKSKIW